MEVTIDYIKDIKIYGLFKRFHNDGVNFDSAIVINEAEYECVEVHKTVLMAFAPVFYNGLLDFDEMVFECALEKFKHIIQLAYTGNVEYNDFEAI